MFLRSCIFLFIVGTFSVFGQNANPTASTAIKANFTMASVKAYQESATLKVEDYYHYLTLFSAESTSESLKNEIKSIIYNLFKNDNSTVIDYTTQEKPPISLKELLTKIENKNYLFSVFNFENSIVASDFWTTKYQLTILQNGKTMQLLLFQKVSFMPILKAFGSTKKEVWTLFLGEVTLP